MSFYINKDDYTSEDSNNELFTFYEAINNGLDITNNETSQETKDLYSNYLFIYLMSKFLENLESNNSRSDIMKNWKTSVLKKKDIFNKILNSIKKKPKSSLLSSFSFKKSASKKLSLNRNIEQKLANQRQQMVNYKNKTGFNQIKQQITNQFNSTINKSKNLNNKIFKPNDFIEFCSKVFLEEFNIGVVIFNTPNGNRYLSSQVKSDSTTNFIYILYDIGKYHYLKPKQSRESNENIEQKHESKKSLLEIYNKYKIAQSFKKIGGSQLKNKYKKTKKLQKNYIKKH